MGFVLQQDAAQQAPTAHFLRLQLIADLFRRPRWLAGLITMVAGQLLSGWVIGHMVLSLAEPLLATNLLFALLLAGPLSGQRVHKSEVAGALILMAGVTALSLARSVRSPAVYVGSTAYWPFAGAAVVFLVLTFAELGRRRSAGQRAILTGISAGLVFGIADALTRRTAQLIVTGHLAVVLTSWPGYSLIAVFLTGIYAGLVFGIADALTRRTAQLIVTGHLAVVLTSWPGYSLIAVSLTGIWLMESAFNAGPLHISLPGI